MKVSVIIATYNHGEYIAQTLSSIVDQQVDFDFEILVGDDASTDDTRTIIDQYAREHPRLVRRVYPEQNLGPIGNFLNCFQKTQGEYIGFCEGDDYWTDRYKLQKQVDFLDKHQEYGGVSSNNRWFFQEKNEFKDSLLPEGKITFEDLYQGNPINSQTILFRKKLTGDVSWLRDLKIGDWALHLWVTSQLPYYRLPEVTAVYRVHGGGVHSQLREEAKLLREVTVLTALLRHIPLSEYRIKLIESTLRNLLKKLISMKTEDVRKLRKLYFQYGGGWLNKTIIKSYFHALR